MSTSSALASRTSSSFLLLALRWPRGVPFVCWVLCCTLLSLGPPCRSLALVFLLSVAVLWRPLLRGSGLSPLLGVPPQFRLLGVMVRFLLVLLLVLVFPLERIAEVVFMMGWRLFLTLLRKSRKKPRVAEVTRQVHEMGGVGSNLSELGFPLHGYEVPQLIPAAPQAFLGHTVLGTVIPSAGYDAGVATSRSTTTTSSRSLHAPLGTLCPRESDGDGASLAAVAVSPLLSNRSCCSFLLTLFCVFKSFGRSPRACGFTGRLLVLASWIRRWWYRYADGWRYSAPYAW